MKFYQSPPHPALAPYIDAYWTVAGNGQLIAAETILPDGCILNQGDDYTIENESFTVKNKCACLVGTITRFKRTVIKKETRLLGIRFKPAGFNAFYNIYCPNCG